MRRWFADPARFFLTVTLVAGVAMAVLIPPLGGDDEGTHFSRGYAITQGKLVLEVQDNGVGSTLPGDLVEDLFRLRGEAADNRWAGWEHVFDDAPHGDPVFTSYPMAALSPLGHVPEAIGIGLGRLMGLSAFGLFFMARLADLVVYAAIVFAGLRMVPVLRWPFALGMSAPHMVLVAGIASPDGLTVALVFSAVCLALTMRDRLQRAVPIGRGVWAAVFIVAFALGNAKAPYFAAVGVLLLPFLRAPAKGRAALAAACLVCLTVGAVWSLGASDRYVTGAYVGVKGDSLSDAMSAATYGKSRALDQDNQWFELRENPKALGGAIWRMVLHQSDRLVPETFFDYALWYTPVWLAVAGIAVVWFARLATPEWDRAHLSRRERAWVWLVFGGTLLLMLLSLFVYDTPYLQRNPEVMGMQGRYLLPLLPLFLVAMPSLRRLRALPLRVSVGLSLAALAVGVFITARGVYPPGLSEVLDEVLGRASTG